jgi:hypothetical protein
MSVFKNSTTYFVGDSLVSSQISLSETTPTLTITLPGGGSRLFSVIYGSQNQQQSCVEFTTITAKIKSMGYSISVNEDFTSPLLISAPPTIPIGASIDASITTADIKNIVQSAIFNA